MARKPLYEVGETVFHTSKEAWTRVDAIFWAEAGHPLDRKDEHWRYYVTHGGNQWSVPQGALESENAALARQRIQGLSGRKKRRRPAIEPKNEG